MSNERENWREQEELSLGRERWFRSRTFHKIRFPVCVIEPKDSLLVNLVEEKLEIDLDFATKYAERWLVFVLSLQEIFHTDVFFGNLGCDATEHRGSKDNGENSGGVWRHGYLKLVELPRGVRIDGQEDSFLVEIFGSVNERAKLGCLSWALELAQMEVLFGERDNKAFFPMQIDIRV